MQKGLEDMQKIQEETRNELKDRREKGLENVRQYQEDLKKKTVFREKINTVENRIAGKKEEKVAVVEEKMEKKLRRK
ncbi:hypothetical protein TNCV_1411181 [Trichonephila clavipes]|nr:hypothetical protein TNCV_1411181 [Trichonephila clavipes]